MIAFGPVPSRRLGQSLGVNNIPPKACTFDCIYCQVGETTDRSAERRAFYPVDTILAEVEQKIEAARRAGGQIDYLSIVPDGEPTLDVHLGELIRALQTTGIPVAVFTNSTLLDRPDVREELARADWLSLKVDAVTSAPWHRVNRPNKKLDLDAILRGLQTFTADYRGDFSTETMLVSGINDAPEDLRDTARFLATLSPPLAYLAVPTRPPLLDWVQPPDEEALHRAYQIFSEHLPKVELLIGFAEAGFTPTGNAREDLLHITAVHPMRESEVLDYIRNCGESPQLLKKLAREGLLRAVEHGGVRFYVRKYTG